MTNLENSVTDLCEAIKAIRVQQLKISAMQRRLDLERENLREMELAVYRKAEQVNREHS